MLCNNAMQFARQVLRHLLPEDQASPPGFTSTTPGIEAQFACMCPDRNLRPNVNLVGTGAICLSGHGLHQHSFPK